MQTDNAIQTRKALHIMIVTICILIISSCDGHRETRVMLDRADSLMDINPDSALALLDRYKPKADSIPEKLLIRYELLRAKAMNKADVYFTSDTTMAKVVEWYEKNGTRQELMEALYLLGCVYRDLGDGPTALTHYKEAVSLADTTDADCDWYTLCRIHGQMATLFHSMGSPEYALEEWRHTMSTSLKAKDTLNALKAYELQIGEYYMMYNEDSVISITQNVRDKYLQLNRKDLAACALHTLIAVYLNRKEYDKAKEYMDEFEQYSGYFDADGNIRKGQESYYETRIRYYLGKGKTDSAFVYLRKLLMFKDNIMCAEAAYEGLMNLYMKQGKADSVIKYAKLYCAMNDSSAIVRSAEEINRTQAIYNYNHAQQIAEERTKEADGYKRMLIYGTLAVIVIAFLLYRLYVIKKRKTLAKKNMEYNSLLQKYSNASDELSKAISDMENFKKDKEKEINDLRNSIAAYQEDMAHPEAFDLERNMKNSEIAMRLHGLAAKGKEATTKELRSVTALMENGLPDFYSVITDTKTGLNEREMIICMLIRLGFIPSEIATLFCLSLQSITNIKSKINRKLFLAEGAKSLDSSIRSL